MKIATTIAHISSVLLLAALAGAANAQPAYPTKPIHIIVAFPAGGGYDLLARMVGQKLTESWGQPVIVDNRPGANSIIGTDAAAKSPPDGYTLLSMGGGLVITPLLIQTPFDVFRDFAPITTTAKSEFVLAVNPSVPANNLQQLIALAKGKPGQLNYASAGNGSVPHLAGELLKIAAGIDIRHIPYKGGVPAVTDLIGGQVEISIQPAVFFIAHIKSGKLKALAITGDTRSPALPQVPSFIESGLPSFDIKSWFGFSAPAGTPKPIIDRLATAITKMLTMPDIKEKLAGQGMDPFAASPEQMAALMKADAAKYTKIINTAHIKLED